MNMKIIRLRRKFWICNSVGRDGRLPRRSCTCGVVIAPDTLVNYIPLEMAQRAWWQLSSRWVSWTGSIEDGLLGLSNLTIINNAMRIIRKAYKKEINLSELTLDDKKTYELFQRGDTTGVFQLESAGMKRYLRGLKPTTFEDIVLWWLFIVRVRCSLLTALLGVNTARKK